MKDFPLSLIIKAVDRATGPLKRINDRIEQTVKPLRAFRREFSRALDLTGINALHGRLGDVRRTMGNVSRETGMLAFRTAAALGIIGYAFKTQFLDTATEFERLRTNLFGLEKSNEGVQKSMAWITQFATKTPLELAQVTEAFIKLRNWGLDPMDGSLATLTDAASKMAGPEGPWEGLQGMILAMGQATASQRLMGQDTNQMINRGIKVWPLLAQATGKTIAQLKKLQDQGKLGAKYIKILMTEIAKDSEGAAARLSKTWMGITSNISDAWQIFVVKIMNAGVFDFMKGKLQDLLNWINKMQADGTLQKWAEQIGKNITDAMQAIWDVLPDVWEGLRELGGIIKNVVAFVGGWKNATILLGLVIAGPLLAALASLTTAVVLLGITLAATPFGWVILAIGAIIGLGYLFGFVWEAAMKTVFKMWEDFATIVGTTLDGVFSFIETFDIGAALGTMIKAGFDVAAAFVPDWFKNLVSGAWDFGSSLSSDLEGLFGVNAAAPAPARSRVDVNFGNVPRGTRITQKGGNGFTGVNLSAGWSNQEAY
jgi:tape measure domain-containing protein